MTAQTVNTDVVVMRVIDVLSTQMELWDDQQRLKQVESALYMVLQGLTITAPEQDGQQLPAEYVDDTPRVLEAFLRCLRLEKRTENTIKNYRGELKCLFDYLRKNYADVTGNDIRGYLAWRQAARHNSDVTLNNKIHVFQSFFKWVMSEDLVEDGGFLLRKPKKNPMDKVHKIKTEKKVRVVLTEEQVEIIRCDCKTVRDRAIVEILAATGMRISELTGLDMDDLDISRNRCIIYGKGRKERMAYFTPKSIVHLKEYMAYRRTVTDAVDNALFLNGRRVGGQYTRVSNTTIRKMLQAIVEDDQRLEGVHLHPHAFRSYLATYMARHGASLMEISRVLGHANINTTSECYVVTDTDEVQAAHKKFAA